VAVAAALPAFRQVATQFFVAAGFRIAKEIVKGKGANVSSFMTSSQGICMLALRRVCAPHCRGGIEDGNGLCVLSEATITETTLAAIVGPAALLSAFCAMRM
jgi:hypothetical protein